MKSPNENKSSLVDRSIRRVFYSYVLNQLEELVERCVSKNVRSVINEQIYAMIEEQIYFEIFQSYREFSSI